MSNRIHKAIFEREAKPADGFGAAEGKWLEVAREFVGWPPVSILGQGREFIDAQQIKGIRKSVADCAWSPTMATVDSSCRMKIAKTSVVDEQEPDNDVNFRIFGIESILNVGELNRELQFMVVEKV